MSECGIRPKDTGDAKQAQCKVHVLFVGRMEGMLSNMIHQIEKNGHTGQGTTKDSDAERLLRDSPAGTFDAVWYGPPIPAGTQRLLSEIAASKGIQTQSMKCCCPSEVVDFVAQAAEAKGAKLRSMQQSRSVEAKQRALEYVALSLAETRQQHGLSSAAVKALLQENEARRRTLETDLRALMETQLMGAESCVQLLKECAEQDVPQAQARLERMDTLAGESGDLLKDFPFDMNQVRENLFQTRKLLREMVMVDQRVEKVKNALQDEEQLLEAHGGLLQLSEMRARAVVDAQRGGDQFVMDGVERFFRGVVKLEARFDALLKQHMDATFELARKRPSLLKQVLKVIELEEKADLVRPAQLIKGYYGTLREKLSESLEKRFNAIFANAAQTDITEALVIVEQIYDNLPIVQQVNRFFPSKYMMYEFYAGNIHRNLRACLANLAVLPRLTSGDVVNMYYWSHFTYVKKLETLNLNPSQWPIADTLKPAIPTYTAYLRTLMNQWSLRLLEQDRTNPSYVEMPQNLMTDSIVTLYKFVNQQLDLVSHTKDSCFVLEVSRETSHIIFEFQRSQTEMLTNSLSALKLKYLLALVNNNAKAFDYTGEYEVKVRGLLSEPELGRFEKENDRQSLVEGFENVRLLVVRCIGTQLFDLFRESNVLSRLFTKEWVNPPADEYQPMEIVVQTLSDAMDKMVRRHLRDKFVSDVAKECMDRLLQRYVQELCQKSGYNATTADCIERDRLLVENAFGPLLQGQAFLTRRIKLMSSIINFLRNSMDDQGQFILTYNALLDDYPDLTPDLVKRIISSRSDCDKAVLEDIISACRGILPSQTTSFKPFFAGISFGGKMNKQ